MKKWFLILLAVVILSAMTACSKETASFSKADLSLTVNGAVLTTETPVQDMLASLGDDYTFAEAISCVYEGMDKTYDYGDWTIYTYPDGEQDRLMELYCVGGDVSTAGGITFGSGKNEIVARYGDGYVEAGSMLSYELPASSPNHLPASLYFELDGGKVCAIGITAEHRAE